MIVMKRIKNSGIHKTEEFLSSIHYIQFNGNQIIINIEFGIHSH